MISAGNDIVALQHASAGRAKDARFYSKIITAEELELYCPEKFSALPFENFVWLLWSIKESVYKYQKRHNPSLLFSPKKIVIKDICLPANQTLRKFGTGEHAEVSLHEGTTYNSIIYYGTDVFYSRSTVHEEFVHTVVNANENFENIWWGVKYIDDTGYENQAALVRCFLINKLSSVFPSQHLSIQKTAESYPLLLNGTTETGIPVSFTHDGNYVGYCFLLRELEGEDMHCLSPEGVTSIYS